VTFCLLWIPLDFLWPDSELRKLRLETTHAGQYARLPSDDPESKYITGLQYPKWQANCRSLTAGVTYAQAEMVGVIPYCGSWLPGIRPAEAPTEVRAAGVYFTCQGS